MTVASGTRRGSADNTPSTSVQMWISLGVQQRAEDRGGEVAAVAAERGLHAAPVDGDEAGNDQGAFEVGRHLRRDVGARLGPLDARAERPPLHDHDAARIDPLHGPARRARSSRKRWNSRVDQISP